MNDIEFLRKIFEKIGNLPASEISDELYNECHRRYWKEKKVLCIVCKNPQQTGENEAEQIYAISKNDKIYEVVICNKCAMDIGF